MKILKKSYVGLGGNIGDSVSLLKQALKEISLLEGIEDLKVSSFYQTTPVSDLSQNSYINAVCSFMTSLPVFELLKKLQQIEENLGKVKKPKNEPRPIDLDLLFFGDSCIKEKELQIPHPRWHERLFVLVPLSELTEEVSFFEKGKITKKNIKSLLREFANLNNETVLML
ncbi:MAG TPA: 2-amino-4-hydroxy-6-hydroxymethyldihydropteridine diphosphokinase [Parachlamydiaceae bacterium]|nr:2-amino-4-hydroxy-6-hydroxymethyldihydropteridine diphosphokinase [Parachlamydiaceae bacterium]